MRAGFAKRAISGSFQYRDYTVHDDLFARVLVMADREITGIIISLDTISAPAELIAKTRAALSGKYGLPLGHIVICHTHNHSCPHNNYVDVDKMVRAIAEAVAEAYSSCRSAKISQVRTNVGREFTRNRRWYSNTPMGTFSVISNDNCRYENDEIYVKGYVENELKAFGFKTPVSIPESARLDGPVDGEATLIVFTDNNGRVAGGMARFAAHVDQLAFRNGPVFSAEYPGYLLRKLEKELGGTFLYLNGPNGDIKPYYNGYNHKECERVGEGVAKCILKEMKTASPPEDLKSVDFFADRVYLPAREELSRPAKSLVAEMFELKQDLPSGRLGKLPVKQAREKDEHRWFIDALVWLVYVLGKGDLKTYCKKALPYNLRAVSFNGRFNYLFLMDEVFYEMTERLRKEFYGRGAFDVVSLSDTTDSYLVPDREISRGGYEYTFSLYKKGGFDRVHAAASRLLARVLSGGRKYWDRDSLAKQLSEAGLKAGDALIVHSAIRSCGYVEGGADAIIDALAKAAGKAGTVVFPAFTGARHNSPENPPAFDIERTGCWTGSLSETALKRPEGIRSFHPTHSCVAIGKDAVAVTRDHFHSRTPVDRKSPVYKIVKKKGKILIIGLDLNCLTLVHSAEELLRRPDPCFKKPCKCLMINKGKRLLKDYHLHDWNGEKYSYEIFRPFLEKAGAMTKCKFGDGDAMLLDARKTYDVILKVLRQRRQKRKTK